jgi:hypothetical protein
MDLGDVIGDVIWPLLLLAVGFACERMGYARGRAEACRFFMRPFERASEEDG